MAVQKNNPLAPNFHFCVLYINYIKPQVSYPSDNTKVIYLHHCKTIPTCLCISLRDTDTQESNKPSIPFLSLPPEVVNATSYSQQKTSALQTQKDIKLTSAIFSIYH